MTVALFKFYKKIFDIREGEFRQASLMQLLIFLLISTLLIVKPTVNGLFLSEMGVEALPTAFLLTAIFAIGISTIYSRFLGNVGLNQILTGTLGLSALLFFLFGLLLRLNVVGGWILYGFYLWVAIFGVLTASQFWILANMVFNARQAKRLFGFIGSGAIAGGIFGGYLTSLVAERLDSENLPFVATGLLLICIPIVIAIWKKYVLPNQSVFQLRKKIGKTEHPFRLIRQSPHLTYLAFIIGFSVIVAKLVDYQFGAIASAKIEDPDELTAFFGFWFSNFNVISLAIQLLLTRRVVGTFGVGKSLFFLPVAIFVGALFVFFMPMLWAAIFLKMSDGSLKQSINKAAVELLALPIPAEIKRQTKTFIDVVVDSLATGISGLLLIFLINGLDLSTSAVSLMIVSLIGGWLFFVLKIRKSYLRSFLIHVQPQQESTSKMLDLANESVIGGLKRIMAKGDEGQILAVLKKTLLQPDERLTGSIALLLHHPNDRIKEIAIRNLYFLTSNDFSDIIRPLTHQGNQALKIAAFDYLIARAGSAAIPLMEEYLSNPDHRLRSAALVSLAEESRDNPVLKAKFGLEKRLNDAYYAIGSIADPKLRDFHKIGLLKALGLANLPTFFQFIETFFDDENPKVVRQAILSAGDTADPYFLPLLLHFLGGNASKAEAARDALERFGPGILEVLGRYVISSDAELQVLRRMTLVAEKFGVQPAVDLLFELMKNEDEKVRLSSLRSLNRMKITFPHLNFYEKDVLPQLYREAQLYQDTLSMLYVQQQAGADANEKERSTRQQLIQLLEQRLDHGLERIFRLLGLKYPPNEVMPIYQSIQSRRPEMRVNALEYLDNILEMGLKKVLVPIVEAALMEMISKETIEELNLKIPAEEECYRALLQEGDEEIQNVVRLLKKDLNDGEA